MKQKWRKTYKELSVEYGIAVPTLEKYSKAGVNLDDPIAVNSYKEDKARSKKGNPATKIKRVTRPVVLPKINGTNLSTQLERLQTIATNTYDQIVEAKAKGDATSVSFLLKDYNSVCEQLRRIEVDSPKVDELNKNTVTVKDMTTTLAEMLKKFAEDLDAIPNRTAEKCHGLDKIGIIEIMKLEVEAIKVRLHQTKWEKILDESQHSNSQDN